MQEFQQETIRYMAQRSAAVFPNNTDRPRIMVAPHWHEACEMLLIRRGWGRQRLNASTFPFHSGDLVYIRPGDVHATEATAPDGCDIDVVQFLPSVLGRFEGEMDGLNSRVITSAGSEMVQWYDRLVENAGEKNLNRQDMTVSGLLLLMMGMLKYDRNVQMGETASETITQIRAWLEKTTDWSLARVADQFGYCSEHLSRKFHAEVGIPFRQYCDQIRMRRAVVWLEEGLPSLEIAERLGYSDTGSFIRAFRRIYGLTPSAYNRLRLSGVRERP